MSDNLDQKQDNSVEFEDISSGERIWDNEEDSSLTQENASNINNLEEAVIDSPKTASPISDFFSKISLPTPKRSRVSKIIAFNNGEPLTFSLKRIIFELFVVAFVFTAVFGLYLGVFLVETTLSANSSITLEGDDFEEKQSVSIEFIQGSNNETAILSTISQWAGKTDTKTLADDLHPNDLRDELQAALPSYYIDMQKNVPNFDLLMMTYQSLKNGRPVIVMIGDETDGSYEYAIVDSFNGEDSVVGITGTSLRDKAYSTEDLINLTRFNTEEQDLLFKIGLVIGKYDVNTVFFIDDKNDNL